MGNYRDSYKMSTIYQKMDDSLKNELNRKISLTRNFQYVYDKKRAADSLIAFERKRALDIELKQEKTYSNAALFGLGLIIIFSFFIFNRYKVAEKQKAMIGEQKQEMIEKKLLVEMKQKEITDSIHYAKRIQLAQLPTMMQIERLMMRLKEKK